MNHFPGSRPSTMESRDPAHDSLTGDYDGSSNSRLHKKTINAHQRRTRGGRHLGGDGAGFEDEEDGCLSAGALERREKEQREANMREWEAEMAGDLDRQLQELIAAKRNKAEVRCNCSQLELLRSF